MTEEQKFQIAVEKYPYNAAWDEVANGSIHLLRKGFLQGFEYNYSKLIDLKRVLENALILINLRADFRSEFDAHIINQIQYYLSTVEPKDTQPSDEWIPFDYTKENYVKKLCDIRLKNGDFIFKCFPNAGYFTCMDEKNNTAKYYKYDIPASEVAFVRYSYTEVYKET